MQLFQCKIDDKFTRANVNALSERQRVQNTIKREKDNTSKKEKF